MRGINPIVISVLVVVSLAIVYLLVAMVLVPCCDFVSTAPDENKLLVKTGHTDDFKALVSASAYLKYTWTDKSKFIFKSVSTNLTTTDQSRYVSLAFSSYNLSKKLETNKEKHILTLNADCAQIDISLTRNNSSFWAELIEISLPILDVSGRKSTSTCKIFDAKIIQHQNKHYKCKDKAYRCVTNNKLVAILVFKIFEFEIYGDPDETKQNKFTNPGICSYVEKR